MQGILISESKEKILDAAEHLFSERGYASVKLRDIASEVGIQHASLYHHVPGGKSELFILVTERMLTRHKEALESAIESTDGDLRDMLVEIARWLLSQPPMDLLRMTYSDMPELDTVDAERLSMMAFESMIVPIADALEETRERGLIAHENMILIAGGYLGMIESLHAVPEYALRESRDAMAEKLIDVLVKGLGI